MKALFALCGQWGHIVPTLPTAAALRDRGHRVEYAFVDHEPLNNLVDAHGFARRSLRLSRAEESTIMASGTGAVMALPPEELEERALATWFRPLAEPMLESLVELANDADVVIHENTTFAAPLAADMAGIPSVLHGAGASFPAAVQYAALTMKPLWARHGRRMPALAGLMGSLYLNLFPPGLPEPSADLAARVQQVRPGPPMETLPAPRWLDGLGDRPLVLVTFGTNFNKDPELWRSVLTALGDEDIEVVAATGPGNDLDAAEQLHPNVHAAPYLPLAPLLERCSLVICHGGAGTTLAALSCGVPLLFAPQGADQFYIAGRVEARGAGWRLDLAGCGAQVRLAIESGTLGRGAGALRRSIAAMPQASEAVIAIEELAR